MLVFPVALILALLAGVTEGAGSHHHQNNARGRHARLEPRLGTIAQVHPKLHQLLQTKASVNANTTHFIAMDLTRVNRKLYKSQTYYKANKAADLDSLFTKRHTKFLHKARALEARALMSPRSNRIKRASSGNVDLDVYFSADQDVAFYGSLGIGTPTQTFDVIFDTGSGDCWVPSDSADTSHTKFNSDASETLETSTAKWGIAYGTGSSSGYIMRDSFSVAGLAIKQQIFALADTIASSISVLPSDGICGISFSTISSTGAPTIFENLVSQSAISQPILGYYARRSRDLTSSDKGSVGGGGELCFGCTDSGKYSGSISYTSVSVQAFWEIPMTGIAIDGTVISGTSATAAIDTGTSLIYVPTKVASALYKSIGGTAKGDGSYVIPCDGTLPFATIALTFSGKQYAINLEDVILGYDSSDPTQCYVGIIGQDSKDASGNTVAIVGNAFLKSVYTVFSYSHGGNPAVGFAVSSTADISDGASALSLSGSGEPSATVVASAATSTYTSFSLGTSLVRSTLVSTLTRNNSTVVRTIGTATETLTVSSRITGASVISVNATESVSASATAAAGRISYAAPTNVGEIPTHVIASVSSVSRATSRTSASGSNSASGSGSDSASSSDDDGFAWSKNSVDSAAVASLSSANAVAASSASVASVASAASAASAASDSAAASSASAAAASASEAALSSSLADAASSSSLAAAASSAATATTLSSVVTEVVSDTATAAADATAGSSTTTSSSGAAALAPPVLVAIGAVVFGALLA